MVARVNSEDHKKLEDSFYQRGLFLNMALNMTWQLAIAVIVPIVGGYELDQHFRTSPAWTIVGAVVAVLGFIAILRRVVVEASRRAGYQSEPKNGGKK